MKKIKLHHVISDTLMIGLKNVINFSSFRILYLGGARSLLKLFKSILFYKIHYIILLVLILYYTKIYVYAIHFMGYA